MKKIIYTLALLSSVIFFMSNSGGYGESNGEGITGAPGDQFLANGDAKTCQFCHNSGTFNPSATIAVFDEAGSNAVTKYEAGKIYTVRFTINAGSGAPSGYGFQMIDIRKSNNANVKGFVATQAAGIKLTTLSGRIYAEHSTKSTAKTIDIKWKAPSPSVGTVTFYAVGNAVDGKGSTGGDNGTASVKVDLADLTSSVNELAVQIEMSVSPNPSAEMVNLSLTSQSAKNIQIQMTDIGGRTVMSEKWQIQAGENFKQLNINHLVKGAYMVQIIENQNVVSKKIVKI
jgi:Secretion system C-terminal sorting domain/Reeler domain